MTGKIVVTGGSGRFGKILKDATNEKYKFPNRNKLNIMSLSSIEKYLKENNVKTLIHLAGLSRPMLEHEKNIIKSINLNIVGTCNIVIVCKKLNIKLIYFSTSYVYPGNKGNYKETDPILPVNNYAWSKLGGEAAVQMYKNSLIIRACMTEKPFVHDKALTDVYLNFIFQEEIAKILPKLIKMKGILNVGGPIQTVYKFASKYNPSVKKISSINIKKVIYKKKMSMNISKFTKIIKKKN
jgi:dTDP-4-dehydrorhamnose reductase|tara:strand:- start:5040 stop:5756 length:717 start_codon:yes stop_codon:yes gene_type:complete